jgi:hypothetical protein
MNKKSAIRAIEFHINEINSITNLEESEIWRRKTLDSLARIVGKESLLYKRLEEFRFHASNGSEVGSSKRLTWVDVGAFKEYNKDRAKVMLLACIDSVNAVGVIQPKGNFITRVNDGTIVAVITFCITGLLWVGYYFGSRDQEHRTSPTPLDTATKKEGGYTQANDSTNKDTIPKVNK